jgi:hypothetical protein
MVELGKKLRVLFPVGSMLIHATTISTQQLQLWRLCGIGTSVFTDAKFSFSPLLLRCFLHLLSGKHLLCWICTFRMDGVIPLYLVAGNLGWLS